AEYIIFQFHSFVDRDIVLYLAFVSDDNIIPNVYILSKNASLTNNRTGLDMRKMPDLCSLANRYVIINI
ncbi:uncharacterized protein METZ01_LOCUS224520, partial [marine metagenome]